MGVFIVYSAGMVCISFSTMMDAFTVLLLGSPGPELRAIFMIRWRASVFGNRVSVGMACRAYRLAGKKAGSDERIGQEREKGEFRTI